MTSLPKNSAAQHNCRCSPAVCLLVKSWEVQGPGNSRDNGPQVFIAFLYDCEHKCIGV